MQAEKWGHQSEADQYTDIYPAIDSFQYIQYMFVYEMLEILVYTYLGIFT